MTDSVQSAQTQRQPEVYFVPHHSHWPFFLALGMPLFAIGAVNLLHGHYLSGSICFFLGVLAIVSIMAGWFRDVIMENLRGDHGPKSDMSFRWGMGWFIFSESCLFGTFFGSLLYVRQVVVPWIAGEFQDGPSKLTHLLSYPDFQNIWPLLKNPSPTVVGPDAVISAWGIPALNTLILLVSGVTLTFAHWALKKEQRKALVFWLAVTILLGVSFLGLQAHEYVTAIYHEGLTFSTGIYASTFFMLTGFHGAHVTVGAIMLTTMMFRAMRGHFTEENHFAFEATAWYWHFVDVVWILLFIFVYWL